MREITKSTEPRSLTRRRAAVVADDPRGYDDYNEKDELRAALVAEQRALCCYCMGRIVNDPLKMKIEHWRCQATYPDQQLVYKNLLGACLGGEGQPPRNQHCDTRKADQDLRWSPAVPADAIEARIRYLVDGSIESTDANFDYQIREVLGLNTAHLKNDRKAALDSMLEWWRTTPKARKRLQEKLSEKIGTTGELEPFSPVAVWFLRDKMEGGPA